MSDIYPTGEWDGPVFIVGLPRSGTKLLRAILNNHSRIAISRVETELFPYWVSQWNSYGQLQEWDTFRAFSISMERFPYFVYQAEAGRPIPPRLWYDSCAGFSPEHVFEGLIRCELGIAPGMGVIWGDKSPSYVNHLPLLAAHFPTAKFIHIVRDVRDYCLSINKAWGKNMRRAAQRWADSVGAIRGLELGPRYLEVRFEDLIGDPGAVAERACRFLGVPYERDMVRLGEAVENVGDAKGSTQILQGNHEKYARMMSPEDIRRIEEIAVEVLRSYGYLVTYSGPPHRLSSLQMGLYKLLDGVNLVRSERTSRGLAGALRFYWNYAKSTHVAKR